MTERYKVAATHSIDVNEQKISSAMEEVVFAVQQHEARRQTYDRRTNAHESKVSGTNRRAPNPRIYQALANYSWKN